MSPRAELAAVAGALAIAVAVMLAPAAAHAQKKPRSQQEEQRRKLLEEMGLHKRDGAPPSPKAEPPVPADEPAADKEDKTETAPTRSPGTPAAAPVGPSFRRVIHPLLLQTCKGCHAPGAAGALTALVLSGDAGADHAAARRVIDVRAPAASAMLAKASGQKLHAGGAPWPVGGAAYGRVLAWIQAGARLDGARGLPPVAAAPPVLAPPASRPGRKSEAAKPTGEPSAAAPEPEPPVATPAPREPSDDQAAPARGGEDAGGPRLPAAAADDFAGAVHPLLMRTCSGCHGPVGYAAATRLVLSGEVQSDYTKVRALVDPAAPARSPLITKGAGEMHGGGPVIPAGSADQALLLGWIAAGAAEHAARPAPAGTAPPTVAAPSAPLAVPVAVPAPPPASPAAAHHPHGGGGIGLPVGLMLNGRFDLAYERRNFTGSPFADGATNALRSYHHFLFLSREAADDPFGLSLEILTLQFWEIHYRWRAKKLPVQVLVSGGKIFVPFGADPLMHQSYGGFAGFDQRILPIVWAQEGAAVHVTVQRRELAITDDLYVVRGYALRQPDGVLNLQNDFSPADDTKLGFGNRLGAAYGPLSAWYSSYYNPLGFGRRLFMQAADVMLWRLRRVPVLGHFSFAAGAMRADVSGGDDQGVGGPGKDYYHFGSYFQLRYHPTEWLTVQYRQGLRTFNNRRGVIVDDTRLTSDDGSTHNFGVIARTRGLTAGAYYYINVEKGPEIPDDFFRFIVSYDF